MAKNNVGIYTGIGTDFFDMFFNQVMEQTVPSVAAVLPKKEKEGELDYLEKGERLLSLARDAYLQGEMEVSEFELELMSVKVSSRTFFDQMKALSKVFRKYMKQAENMAELVRELFPEYPIYLEPSSMPDVMKRDMERRASRVANEEGLQVRIGTEHIIHGCRFASPPKSWDDRLYHYLGDEFIVTNLADVLAGLYLCALAEREVKKALAGESVLVGEVLREKLGEGLEELYPDRDGLIFNYSKYCQYPVRTRNKWKKRNAYFGRPHDVIILHGNTDIYTDHDKKIFSIIGDVCKEVLEFANLKASSIRYRRSLKNQSCATCYMTKKNIPQKTLSAMESSILNDIFGYIEYDEMCDLGKLSQMEEEIKGITSELFPYVDSKTVSLRVRRLGKHKAAGLYFPFLRCLCVDVQSPSSFMHEYGHMMDYLFGNLSDVEKHKDFVSLYRAYVNHLIRNASDPLLQRTGKYGFDYYREPTEVFARCFEIYLLDILHVNSSLLKPKEEEAVVYPRDARMLSLIESYFKPLLARLEAEHRKEVA